MSLEIVNIRINTSIWYKKTYFRLKITFKAVLLNSLQKIEGRIEGALEKTNFYIQTLKGDSNLDVLFESIKAFIFALDIKGLENILVIITLAEA